MSAALPEVEVPPHLRPVEQALPSDPAATWGELRRVGVALPLRDYIVELWARREFALTVPLSELRAQNQDTALGQLWHLLNPLFLVAVYYVIFGVILDASGRGGIDNYVAFLLVGVITFEFTRKTLQSGSRMIVKNRRLVQSINFPRAVLPISALVSETVSYLWAIPVMWGLLILTGVRPAVTWVLVVPILALQSLFNLGMSMAVARASFHYRDIAQFLPYVMRIWFYASGVIFPVTAALVPQAWARRLLELNPPYAYIEMARDAFIDGTVDPRMWRYGLIWGVVALSIGFWFFRQAESEYGRV